MEMDITAIERILPHRYPFLMVDRITELEPGERGGEIDIISFLPGDVDFDGDVDPWDIQAILAANSYENGFGWGWESGDFDGDMDVDWRDIQMILDHDMYGPGLKDALVSMVPEPATLCLLALGALAAVRRRRR